MGRVAALHAWLRGPRWTRERVSGFQSRQLRRLVLHAATNVPHYRALFAEAGLRPEDVQSIEALKKIPLTTRTALQARLPREVVAGGCDPRQLVVHATSGSTGQPLTIRRTRFEETLLAAFRLREMAALGLRLTDRRAVVVFVRAGDSYEEAVLSKVPWHARRGLLPIDKIHCLQPIDRIVVALREKRPAVLIGYPGVLAQLADQLTEADRAMLPLRFVVMGGETVSVDLRERIEQGFRVPCYDSYGAHECNLIATQCPVTGLLHVLDESVIVEVLRDGEPVGVGEEGEVVLTSLYSFAMPFIRYPLGDLAVRGQTPCPCGAPRTTLRQVVGRRCELFRFADGSTLHPYVVVSALLGHAPWVKQYRIVQESHVEMTVTVIAHDPPDAAECERVTRHVEAAIGRGVNVRLLLVDSIPAGPGGKLRPYETRVRNPQS